MPMRRALLALVLLATPAGAQTFSDAVGDALPALLDAALDDFATMRGDPTEASASDSTWAASFEIQTAQGPLQATVTRNVTGGQDVTYYETSLSSSTDADRDVLRQLFRGAVGASGRHLDASAGGVGWTRRVNGEDDPGEMQVIAWMECPERAAGRHVMLGYVPSPRGGGSVRIRISRFHAESCAATPHRFGTYAD